MSEDQPPVDELFGDEDLGLDPGPAPKSPSRFAGMFANKPIAIYIGGGLLLFILYVWAASANGDDFYLSVEDDGHVQVQKGYGWLPFGHGDYDPPNRGYRPFKLPAGMAPENTGPMTREELDEALHGLYLKIAEHELSNLEAGEYLISRNIQAVFSLHWKVTGKNRGDEPIYSLDNFLKLNEGLAAIRQRERLFVNPEFFCKCCAYMQLEPDYDEALQA